MVSDWSDLTRAIVSAARAEYDTIVQEFANRRLDARIQHLRALADELGYRIVRKDADDTQDAPLYGVEANGQIRLIG